MCSGGPTKREIDASVKDFLSPKPITFDEALASNQPVVELATRFGISESQPMTESEQYFWQAFYFLGDSLNGGVDQALSNSTGDVFEDVHDFTRKYCTTEISALFGRIADVFPDSKVPSDRDVRNDLLDEVCPDDADAFGSINMRLYDLEAEFMAGLLKFAKVHRSEFKTFGDGEGDA